MKNKNLLESLVEKKLQRRRLNEISELIKEYDSLDSILIENKSYDRDVQIVVRLDELGMFDDILEVVPRERKEARKRNMFVGKELEKTRDTLKARGIPDDIIQSTLNRQRQNLEKSWDEGRTIDSRLARTAAQTNKSSQQVTEPTSPTSKSSNISRLGRMLGSALKSGKTALVSRIKAAINKVRGKKPDASVADIPDIPANVATQVDKLSTNTTVADKPVKDPIVNTDTNPTTTMSNKSPELKKGEDELSRYSATLDRQIAAGTLKPGEKEEKMRRRREQILTSLNLPLDTVFPGDNPPDTPTGDASDAEVSTEPSTTSRSRGVKKITGGPNRGKSTTSGTNSNTNGADDEPETPTGTPAASTGAESGPEDDQAGTNTTPPETPAPASIAQQSFDKAKDRLGLGKNPEDDAPGAGDNKPPATDDNGDTTSGTSGTSTQGQAPEKPPATKPATTTPAAGSNEPAATDTKGDTTSGTSDKPESPEQKPEPKKPVQPWSKQGIEARAKELAAMSPEEKARQKQQSMRRMGFVPDKRSFVDRVKSAGRAFVAPAGTSVQTEPVQWKSRFAEVLQMMEELQQIERQLHELSLAEGLVGGQNRLDVAPPYGKITGKDFAALRARRKHLRGRLVKEMIREELGKHNTTLAELNPRQRAALMEYVTKRSNKMWEMMAEMRMNEDATEH